MSFPNERYLQGSIGRLPLEEEREYEGMDFDLSLGVASIIGGALSIVTVAALLLASVAFADDSAYGASFNASAQLSGGAEVSPVSTNGHGSLTLTGTSTELQYTLNVFSVEDATAAHLHCGAVGVNGPVVVTLFSSSSTNANGLIASGTIDDSEIEGVGCATTIETVADLRSAILNGYVYVNVHSLDYPNGEIRGQLSGWFSQGGCSNNYGCCNTSGCCNNNNCCSNSGCCNGGCSYDKSKGCDYNYGENKKYWNNNDWNNWNYDCKKPEPSPCANGYSGWSGSHNCWCDKGKPDYNKDQSGHDKNKNDGYAKDGNDGKDGKDGQDGYASGGNDKKDEPKEHDYDDKKKDDDDGGYSDDKNGYSRGESGLNLAERILGRAGLSLGL